MEVAAAAGVSKSTVSRVLSGGYVSVDARRRINEAIERLNYHPYTAARVLVKNQSRTLGIVVADSTDAFFSTIVRGIVFAAAENGYDIQLLTTFYDENLEVKHISKLAEGSVDGIIVIGSRRKWERTELCIKAGQKGVLPIVMVEPPVDDILVHTISIDNRRAAFEATRYLVSLGHTEIAHLSGPSDLKVARDRLAGYIWALEESALPVENSLIIERGLRKADGLVSGRLIWSLPKQPTAVFAANDFVALGVWETLNEKGLCVPTDLSLVGFDNLELLEIAGIPLTTVDQPRFAMGVKAVAILLDTISGKLSSGDIRHEVLESSLVIRSSAKRIG